MLTKPLSQDAVLILSQIKKDELQEAEYIRSEKEREAIHKEVEEELLRLEREEFYNVTFRPVFNLFFSGGRAKYTLSILNLVALYYLY